VKDSTLGERAAATAVWAIMKAKMIIGMDLKMKKKKIDEKTNITWQNAIFYLFYCCLRLVGQRRGKSYK